MERRDSDKGSKDRKAYETPRLQVYGSVKEMTQAGTSGADEAGSSSGQKKSSTSDRRTKENIVEVGWHPLGFGIYLFNYKPEFQGLGGARQFGVMADEVELVLPQAVSVDTQGFKMVNYEMLGIGR